VKSVFRSRIEEIERLTLHGSLQDARAKLLELYQKRIPREELAPVANLMRQAHFPEKGVQLLHRHVRPGGGTPSRASDAEKAAYGLCLCDLGATAEAIEILSALDGKRFVRASLYLGLSYITNWDWAAAVPLFEAVIDHPKALPRERLTAQVWLGGALTLGREEHARSQKLLERALSGTGPELFRLLRKHGMRFLIENYFFQRNFKASLEAARELEKLAREDRDPLFGSIADQWVATLKFARDKNAGAFGEAMREAEKRLISRGYWWAARQCEYYAASMLGDRGRLLRLYAGSKHPAFRERVARRLGSAVKLPVQYDWCPGGGKATGVLEVANGQNTYSSTYLKEGQIQQRLLSVLSCDFFLPITAAEIHERLYPGEHYNPASSPDRVHQALKRLRAWLKRAGLPLGVRETRGFYVLDAPAGFALRVDVGGASRESGESPRARVKLVQCLSRVEEKFGDREFSAADFARCARLSHPSAVRYLREALAGRLVSRKGAGPATRYRITA
jgi:hypothetical protein